MASISGSVSEQFQEALDERIKTQVKGGKGRSAAGNGDKQACTRKHLQDLLLEKGEIIREKDKRIENLEEINQLLREKLTHLEQGVETNQTTMMSNDSAQIAVAEFLNAPVEIQRKISNRIQMLKRRAANEREAQEKLLMSMKVVRNTDVKVVGQADADVKPVAKSAEEVLRDAQLRGSRLAAIVIARAETQGRGLRNAKMTWCLSLVDDVRYEIKTIALLFLRALAWGVDFQLTSKVRNAGILDDVVLKVKQRDGRVRAIFLNLKRIGRDSVPRKILEKPKHSPLLLNYFKSYLLIKERLTSDEDNELFGVRIEDCLVAVHTNSPAGTNLGEKLYLHMWSPESLVSVCGGAYKYDLNDSTKALECLGESEDGRSFLNHFRLFCGQPGVDDLDKLIGNELKKMVDIGFRGLHPSVNVERLRQCYMDNVADWWDMDNVVLDKHSDLLEAASKTW